MYNLYMYVHACTYVACIYMCMYVQYNTRLTGSLIPSSFRCDTTVSISCHASMVNDPSVCVTVDIVTLHEETSQLTGDLLLSNGSNMILASSMGISLFTKFNNCLI